jgi:hypothetical protein
LRIKAVVTASERDYDAGKTKGVNRHFFVDVLGWILCVVPVASLQYREDEKLVLAKIRLTNNTKRECKKDTKIIPNCLNYTPP